jgi:hypothetical protein
MHLKGVLCELLMMLCHKLIENFTTRISTMLGRALELGVRDFNKFWI